MTEIQYAGQDGIIIRRNNITICFDLYLSDCVADAQLAVTLLSKGPFDFMFVPINGHDWKRLRNNPMGNMTYREALDFCGLFILRIQNPEV